MKRILIATGMVVFGTSVTAQETFNPLRDRQLFFDVLNIFAILSVIYLITTFILQFVRQYLAHKLKSRIIERQTPADIVVHLTQPEKKTKGETFAQWAFVLTAIAIGFLLVRVTLPFGLHSIVVLAASIAAGCAGAWYFTRKTAQL